MEVIVNRGKVELFEALPSCSIALDGYVQGPAIDVDRQRYSFDHHGDCIRLVTSATCVQVLDAIRMGLDLTDIEQVFVNDVDGDTALAVAMLLKPSLVMNPGFAARVRLYGLIDAHGPAYPFSSEERQLLDQVHWAMTPCAQAHRAKLYATCDLGELLMACIERITRGLFVEEPRDPMDPMRMRCLEECAVIKLDSSAPVEIVANGNGWVLVRSDDGDTVKLYAMGLTAFIVYKQQADGTYLYTVAKKSDLSAFPVKRILETLAAIEPGWGGGSCIGGSPRNADGSRSRLEPMQVFSLVEVMLKQ